MIVELAMPGKRRDFAGSFAVEEIDFWFTDPRIRSCSAATKVFFQFAWMVAVKERREVLPTWWDPHAIGKAAGLDPKTSARAYRTLTGRDVARNSPSIQREKSTENPEPHAQHMPTTCLPHDHHSIPLAKLPPTEREKSLLGETPDGRVIVYGVKDKHPNLKWKDGDISEDLQPHSVAQIQIESEAESESESEGGPATPEPPPKPSQKTEPKTRTRAPTETEAAFIVGFHNLHGHNPTIAAGHAIRLNQLVSKHGPELVVEKIGNWWQHELPQTFRGNRTIAAFLTWFDSIPVNGDKSQRDHAPPVYELPAVPERMTPEEVATWQETVHGLARKWDAT